MTGDLLLLTTRKAPRDAQTSEGQADYQGVDVSKRTCSIEGCKNHHKARGWCVKHYERWRRNGDPTIRSTTRGIKRLCKHPDGCDQTAFAKGWCRMHYTRIDVHGSPGPAKRLRGRRGEGWITPSGYRRFHLETGQIYEHQVVMEQILGRSLYEWENVHHINGIRHDNRPQNLELWVRPQPVGQRAADLAEWLLDTYPELVESHLAQRKQLRLIEGGH